MPIHVTYKGKSYTMPKQAISDLVSFERTFQVSADVLNDPSQRRTEHLMYLVWRGMRRTGVIGDAPFDDEFLDGIEGIENTADDDAADPTVPAAPRG